MRLTEANSLTGEGREPKLSPHLTQALKTVCDKLHATMALEKGPHGPVQGPPDCLFFTILSIAADVTGVPLPKDNAICGMYAAVLRLYAYLLMHQDWLEAGVTLVNMDEMFKQSLTMV